MRGRKGLIDPVLEHLPNMAYVVFVIIVIAVIISLFISQSVDIQEAELQVMKSRMINEISVYDEELGLMRVGFVNPTTPKLDEQIFIGKESKVAGKITIGEQAINLNEKWFVRTRPRAGYDVKLVDENIFMIDATNQLAQVRIEAVS